jgi:replication factor A1
MDGVHEMFNIPYDKLIKKISEKSGKPKDEIEAMVKKKIQELGGLLTEEGAAHIIANKLGLDLVDSSSEGRLKLESIVEGLRSVETIGRVARTFELREFSRKDGSQGKVLAIQIIDNTGSIRVVFWDDMADKYSKLNEGDIILIKNALAKKNRNGNVELHINKSSEITVNPKEEVDLPEAGETPSSERKSISELSEQDSYAEIFGTIVNVFDIRFFEVCPKCSKRVKEVGGNFMCSEHGEVEPAYNYVMNVILDDGTGTLRLVFFSSQVEQLLSLSREKVLAYRENIEDFEKVKHELLGQQVVVQGRVSKNELFSRIELVVNKIDTNPDPDKEVKKLEE